MKVNRFEKQVDTMQVQRGLGTDHSVLAMKAAKRMGRSKQKVRTGRTVCRHLLQMINETDNRQPDPRASRRFHPDAMFHPEAIAAEGRLLAGNELMDLTQNLAQAFTQNYAQNYAQNIGSTAANDKQFSLAF